jgi:tripartite-type tricarboxylate transporter receptor subunit TctC
MNGFSVRTIAATLVLAATIAAASAQTYPSKPIELVVPFPPGGTTDTIARMIAQRISDNWPQPAIITNRPGGGSTIGTATVAKAAPDGHTLLVSTIGFAINATLLKPPYDSVKDFAPIIELTSIPLMLVVHSSLPVTNLKEFIAYAKSQPGGLDYASSGTGTSPHLAAEMFKTMTGANLVHVPYRGNAEVSNALLGGHVKVHFGLVPPFMPHVRNGALRVIAVTTSKRLVSMPEVPTIAELGLPEYEIGTWQGLFAPANTPKDVVAKINGEVGRMLETPVIRERLLNEGSTPVGGTPEQFSERVRNEIDKWAKVITASGLAPK